MRFVTRAQKHISVFISHSEPDNREASRYEKLLNEAGFTAFQYGDGLRYGEEISIVFDRIRECHFFFVIISDYSLNSDWVQKEFGLALTLRNETKGYKPIIIPFYAKNASWRRSRKRPEFFPTRDFESGQEGEAFNLLSIRGLDKYDSPRADADEKFVQFMQPYLLVSRCDFDDEATFYKTKVFELYDQVFPVVEQDSHQDIMDWVLRTDLGQERFVELSDGTILTYALDSRFFILCVAGQAIGLSFVTYDYASRLLYGNYIAVQRCWRGGEVAKAFMAEIMNTADGLFPDYEGTVFEVETFDKARIQAIIEYLETSDKQFQSDTDRDEIRKFLRAFWYQQTECRFFIDRLSQEPLVFTSPSLDPTEEARPWQSGEVEYWIMWRRRTTKAAIHVEPAKLWAQAANAIWIEILAKSLVDAFPNTALEYWRYANDVVERGLKRSASKEIILGKYLDRHSDGLIERWVKLGIDIAI